MSWISHYPFAIQWPDGFMCPTHPFLGRAQLSFRDTIKHPISTIRCFGWRVFFRAVGPWQGRTFLSVVHDAGFLAPSTSSMPTILERCIALELRAKRIYKILAKALDDQGLVGPFFAGLVEQEQYHVDLLELARAAAIRGGWKANLFNPWEDYLPRLEQHMADAEAAVPTIDSGLLPCDW